MQGTLYAPGVLHIAPAMTRLPPSATVTKASTELSKTPLPWLVQVSRAVTKDKLSLLAGTFIVSVRMSVIYFSLLCHLSFPHESGLFFSNMIELNLDICQHYFIPPYLNFEKNICYEVLHS